MSRGNYEDRHTPETECTCTNPVHGGKLFKCGTEECRKEEDHPKECRCEVCRFWS